MTMQTDKTASDNSTAAMKSVALRTYAQQQQVDHYHKRILDMLPMVNKIANRVIGYIKPSLSFEDLVSAGTIGLIKAARDYDPAQNTEFSTYAYIRIKGAIIDELRKASFVPAKANKLYNQAEKLSSEILNETGTSPTHEQLADKLEITTEKLDETLAAGRTQHFISIDEEKNTDSPSLAKILICAKAASPGSRIEKSELLQKLAQAIMKLPEKQRQVIILYYKQNLTMKQAAQVFDVTESRISQLHASAIFNLSVYLKDWTDERC